jgi:hypothetical protein
MPHLWFHLTITLNEHLAAAGMSNKPAEAVAAIRRAIECMDGARWIHVEAQSCPVG